MTQSRGTARADNGMVATSHPLAAQAGIEMLDAGGSAADAAVAAAAVLNVVDPRSTGIGGDAFALCWIGDGPTALAGAGPASARLSVDELRSAGFEEMPDVGPWTVTVPGSVSAWEAVLNRYGRLDFERILVPAIRLAEEGVAVAPRIAADWARNADRLGHDDAARRTFLPRGRAPVIGERFANPALASTFRRLAAKGPEEFYRGVLGGAVGSAVRAAGGPLGAEDLAAWTGAEWVQPIRRRYCGVDVYVPPPPGQGIVALQALGIYEKLRCEDRVDEEHGAIEALKLAFADAQACLADPRTEPVPVERLLADDYLAARREQIDATRARVAAPGPASDTVYVAVADRDGGACSFIQSLYEGFGSGICVPDTGVLLQNRGSGFRLDDRHPNRPEPGKRPYHTIMPAMLARDGAFVGCLGVVGGFMQPQGQMQVIREVFDRGLSPQAAVDAPRFRVLGGVTVAFEPGFDPDVVNALADRGHQTAELSAFEAGGAQLVLSDGDGFAGASDGRKDGCAHGR